MTRNLAKHLGPHRIRVNAIAPGFIKSGPRYVTLPVLDVNGGFLAV